VTKTPCKYFYKLYLENIKESPKFKDEMQKPHAAGNGKKNKVKKLQETYRYNEPIFLFI
jgi:hypothetical protein